MLMVNDGKLTDTDMLIGMDVISMCDVVITNPAVDDVSHAGSRSDTQFHIFIPTKRSSP